MIHKDKVTDTSTHHEQMKNFMAAEVFVKCVKYRKFQSIDYTTDGVDDAACQKPAKRGMWEICPQPGKYRQTRPAHGNVMMEENHFGQVIQSPLTMIPATAIPHTRARRVYPILPPKMIMQTGV